MATLSFTKASATSATALPTQTLTASDTVTLPTSGVPYIEITSTPGATLIMTGQGMPKTVNVAGYGSAEFENLSITVAADSTVIQPLAPHNQLLSGEITLTGAEGATVKLFTL